MMATGLLFLEAIFWLEDGANILTLAHHFFGRYGKYIAGISFLFLYYCLEVSYFAGGSPALGKAVEQLIGLAITPTASIVLFTVLFGLMTYFELVYIK